MWKCIIVVIFLENFEFDFGDKKVTKLIFGSEIISFGHFEWQKLNFILNSDVVMLLKFEN